MTRKLHLAAILLACFLTGCSSPSSNPTLKTTVTDEGLPTTALLTGQSKMSYANDQASRGGGNLQLMPDCRRNIPHGKCTYAQEQEMLDKVSQTLKGETAADYHQRGMLYLASGENSPSSKAYSLAVQDFTTCIEIDPKMTEAYNNRATAYARSGELAKAITDFEAAIKLSPSNAALYNAKGIILAKANRDPEAIECYEKAYTLGHTDSAFNRGNAHLRVGHTDLAKRDYHIIVNNSRNPRLVQAAAGYLKSLP
jgi:tetratricopeptide (TPR) repeat protein